MYHSRGIDQSEGNDSGILSSKNQGEVCIIFVGEKCSKQTFTFRRFWDVHGTGANTSTIKLWGTFPGGSMLPFLTIALTNLPTGPCSRLKFQDRYREKLRDCLMTLES